MFKCICYGDDINRLLEFEERSSAPCSLAEEMLLVLSCSSSASLLHRNLARPVLQCVLVY